MGKSMPVTIAVVVDATVVGSYTTSAVRGGQGRGTGQSISEMSVAHILLHTTVCGCVPPNQSILSIINIELKNLTKKKGNQNLNLKSKEDP